MSVVRNKYIIMQRVSFALFFCLCAGLAPLSNVFAAAPTIGIISPNIQSSAPNTAVTFTTTYSDNDGWANLKEAYLLIGTSSSTPTNSAYLYYDQNANKLYLRNDANSGWLGGYAPGSANVIENSYVKLNCASTSVVGSTNTMTVKWNISFKPAYSGKGYEINLYIKDDNAGSAGWTFRGFYTVNSTPIVGTIAPASGNAPINTAQTFTTTYSDADGWQNIHYADFLINTSTADSNCFHSYYNQNSNELYLRNDASSDWLGGYAPGSANVIENSYVKLNCASTTVSGTAAVLTVKWSVVFKYTFTGNKNTYLYVKDDLTDYQDWQQKGTLTIQAIGDATPPTGTIKINNDSQYTKSTVVTLNLSAQDNQGGSGLSQMQFRNYYYGNWSTPENYAATKAWTLNNIESTETVYVKYKDAAGNWSSAVSDSIILDTFAPAKPIIKPVTSPATTDSQTITGTKSYDYDTTTIIVICPTAAVGIPTYSTAATWSCAITKLTPGINNITVQAKDAAGNTSSLAAASIVYNRAPQVGAINPSSGASNIEQAVIFTTTYSDNDGWANLKEAYLLISASSSTLTNSAYLYYDQNANKLYLRNDASSDWLGGYAPGSSSTIENSFVKLNCASTTVSGTAAVMTVKWPVVFKFTFSGNKNTYLYVKDDLNAYQDWQQKGAWTIQTDVAPPTGTISINNNSQYTNSTSVTLNLSAADSGSGMDSGAQMQFSNDNTNWSTPEAYAASKNWTLIAAIGIKTVYVKFKDTAGNWSSAYSDTIILNTIPLKITNISLSDRSICVIGETLNFSINANNKDTLMYRCLIDERVIQDWSNSSTCSFTPQASDRGRHKIKAEVKDNRGGLDSKSVDIYIVRALPKP